MKQLIPQCLGSCTGARNASYTEQKHTTCVLPTNCLLTKCRPHFFMHCTSTLMLWYSCGILVIPTSHIAHLSLNIKLKRQAPLSRYKLTDGTMLVVSCPAGVDDPIISPHGCSGFGEIPQHHAEHLFDCTPSGMHAIILEIVWNFSCWRPEEATCSCAGWRNRHNTRGGWQLLSNWERRIEKSKGLSLENLGI